MVNDEDISHLTFIGHVQSTLKRIEDCPLQGAEGAPEASLLINSNFAEAVSGIKVGDSLIVLTWLHLADRSVLRCYPRNEVHAPHVGVFSTRSPDRPNPIGLHSVKVMAVEQGKLTVYPLEALDGTLLLDLKPVINISEK